MLDVGCNSGEVAVELGKKVAASFSLFHLSVDFGSSSAQRYQPSRVIGVDIDSALIDQCQYTVEHAFSLQKPPAVDASSTQSGQSTPISDPSSIEPTRKKRKVKNGTAQDVPSVSSEQPIDFHYFPSFFPELYGPIDFRGASQSMTGPRNEAAEDPAIADAVTASTSSSQQGKGKRTNTAEGSSDAALQVPSFPRNLVFYSADWTNASIKTDQAGYDVILGYVLSHATLTLHSDRSHPTDFRLRNGYIFTTETRDSFGFSGSAITRSIKAEC